MTPVLEGIIYSKSLKAILIIAHAVESLKYEALMNSTDITKYTEFLLNIKKFQQALSKKDWSFSQYLYRVCVDSLKKLKLDFKTFNMTSSDTSEMCRY